MPNGINCAAATAHIEKKSRCKATTRKAWSWIAGYAAKTIRKSLR
jgi:hypothetical protein